MVVSGPLAAKVGNPHRPARRLLRRPLNIKQCVDYRASRRSSGGRSRAVGAEEEREEQEREKADELQGSGKKKRRRRRRRRRSKGCRRREEQEQADTPLPSVRTFVNRADT